MDFDPRRLLVLLLAAAAFASAVRAQDPPPSPAQEYEALFAERREMPERASNGPTEEDRARARERMASLPLRFLELAERHPRDPVSVDALIQTVILVNGSAFPQVGEGSPGNKALVLLARDHVESEKLGTTCQWVTYGFHSCHESFLRAVLKGSPHREVRGLACFSLAQFLCDRSNRLELLEHQDGGELAERYERFVGKEFFDAQRRADRAAAARETEELFARAVEEFSDVTIPVIYYGSGGKVGEKAAEELYKLRHLVVGKAAPDIEGADQDGASFRLSDYAGKVVLLDFWNYR